MVIANVLNTYTTAAGLWQYDYGQILRLQGIKLPTAVEIHFSLQEKGGESVTRIGTTKDGVTDVVIPDSMLENDDTTTDYKIYAFIYLTDSESGQTEYKISMSVKSRPRPESFEKPEDAELFRQAIAEVNNSAKVALQSKKEAEAWAHGHEECPDRHEDNAKYYAQKAKDEAEKIQGKVAEVKEEVESAQADVEQMRQDTQQSAQSASDANTEAQQAAQQAEASRSAAQTSEQNAAASRDLANTYKANAETAKSAAETAAQNASESKTAAETAAQNAAQSKADIDSIKAGIEEAAKGENVTQIQRNMKDIGQLKESLSNKITKFYASNQGETHITDSDNGKIQDMMIYGKSSQDGTPTTENPGEIKSVVNPVVKVCGKNLLQPNLRYNDKVKINIKKGAKLTLICKNGMVSKGGNLKFEKANGEPKWLGIDKGSAKQQIMLDSDVVAYTYLFNSETSENYALYIGDENTYEPYKEQSMQLHITLNAIPVSSGGNVTIDGQQYIADYVDVERRKVVRKIDKIILTGKENWMMGFESWTTYPHVFKADGLKENILEGNVMNTKYTWYQKKANTDLNSMNAPYNKCIAISDARFSSVNEFTNELKKQDSNGTPLIVYYITSIPQEENLSLEKIEFLKSLSTYYSVTNVTADSEQLDGYTVFNYPISMQNGWNYVKQQLNDKRDYIYDMDLQSAEAYVNSEYAVALTELEV